VRRTGLDAAHDRRPSDETASVTRRAIDDEVEVPLHDVGPPRDPGELSSDPCEIAVYASWPLSPGIAPSHCLPKAQDYAAMAQLQQLLGVHERGEAQVAQQHSLLNRMSHKG
jgi:hypothetical protein